MRLHSGEVVHEVEFTPLYRYIKLTLIDMQLAFSPILGNVVGSGRIKFIEVPRSARNLQLIITTRNEYGFPALMSINNIDILNNGYPMDAEIMTSGEYYQFIARYYHPWYKL